MRIAIAAALALLLAAPVAFAVGPRKLPGATTVRNIWVLCEGNQMAAAQAGTACGEIHVTGYHLNWHVEFHDPDGDCSSLSVQLQARNTTDGDWTSLGSAITSDTTSTFIEGSSLLPEYVRVMPTTVTGCVDPFLTIDLGPEYKDTQ